MKNISEYVLKNLGIKNEKELEEEDESWILEINEHYLHQNLKVG